MSKYVWLGILLAFSFTFFFLRVTKPAIFQSPNNHGDAGIEVGTANAQSSGKKIQVALILDTSNSMDGLIEQAKSQLWKLVNELTTLKKEGAAPEIEIALFQFGNQDLYITKGYIEQITPLSSDFDNLSKHLFSLTTNGGNEYCGWAIKDALKNLAWSTNPNDLKMIFIAGNEAFNQGPENYKAVCHTAQKAGIIVNTIYCGDYFKGKYEFWEEGAQIGGGKYLNIDHNDEVVHTSTPYDDDIMRLNQALNKTYISYGKEGSKRRHNQKVQDDNASQYSSANVRTRAFVKSKKAYKNESWDLVDFTANNELSEVEESELPAELRSMNLQERTSFIEAKRREREQLKQELQEYEAKVEEYIRAHQAEVAEEQTLDHAMLEIIQEQAKNKGFDK